MLARSSSTDSNIGKILLRSLYVVQTQIKVHQAIDTSVFIHHLIKAATTIPQVVQIVISAQVSTDDLDFQLLNTILNAMDRSINILLTGIRRLSQAREATETPGQAIYALIQMYSKLLDCLNTIAVSEAKTPPIKTSSSVKKKQASPSKAKMKHQKQTNIKDNAALDLMTKLLCNIIDGLDPETNVHKSLYEGLVFIILQRLGRRLYLLIFGHPRGPTIEDEIKAFNEPDEIEDVPEAAQVTESDLQLKSASVEAPYLVHLLTRIMNAAPAHLDAAVLTKAGKPKQAVKGSMKGVLAVHARERLQRTLIDCMFGEDGRDDDEFHDCLKMPATKGPPLSVPKIKEPEVQDWFKEEVWRLLGWEILSREIEM